MCVFITVGAEYFQNIRFSKDVGAVLLFTSIFIIGTKAPGTHLTVV